MKASNVRQLGEELLLTVDGSKAPAVTEQEYLRELIATFANTGVIGPALGSVPGLASDIERVEPVLEEFRRDLQALVERRLTPADERRIYRKADRSFMVPRTGDDRIVRYLYLPMGIEPAVAHAMRLLLDPQKKLPLDSTKTFGDDLKQCQWEHCGRIETAPHLPHVRRFFFVSERRELAGAVTGALPQRYCCPEHMREARRDRATESTRARREAVKKLAAGFEQRSRARRPAAKHK